MWQSAKELLELASPRVVAQVGRRAETEVVAGLEVELQAVLRVGFAVASQEVAPQGMVAAVVLEVAVLVGA